MEKITIQEVTEAVGGRIVGSEFSAESAGDLYITGVQTDSRKVVTGDLFIAIVGENNDAHQFLGNAVKAGAAACLISEEQKNYPSGAAYILVEDTVKAMGALAAYYRGQFHIPVIAVTGSVGKTTTKEMLASVLGAKFNVLKTDGNFNNAIGLPITVFRLTHEHEMAVFEMGMNHMGEIDYLTRIGQPDVAVITNVGDAHIGNLGSRENILKAKCEIFHGLREGGRAILNGDDVLLRTQEGKRPFPITWIGEGENCAYRASDIDDSLPYSIRFTAHTPKDSFAVTVPAPGHHMIYPVMTAIAAGELFGLTREEMIRGIASYVPTGMRMKIDQLDGNITLYNDTYNANTQSMMAAIDILAAAGKNGETAEKTEERPDAETGATDGISEKGSAENGTGNEKSQKTSAEAETDDEKSGNVTRVAVLGDMLELGAMEQPLHEQVGTYVAGGTGSKGKTSPTPSGAGPDGSESFSAPRADVLVTVGRCGKYIAEAAKNAGLADVYACADKEEAKKVLAGLVKPDTALLFKASRGMALEELVQYCKELAAAAAD